MIKNLNPAEDFLIPYRFDNEDPKTWAEHALEFVEDALQPADFGREFRYYRLFNRRTWEVTLNYEGPCSQKKWVIKTMAVGLLVVYPFLLLAKIFLRYTLLSERYEAKRIGFEYSLRSRYEYEHSRGPKVIVDYPPPPKPLPPPKMKRIVDNAAVPEMKLTAETIAGIFFLLPKLLKQESDPAIDYLHTGNTFVATLKSAPHLVIKYHPNRAVSGDSIFSNTSELFHQHFDNIEKARALCVQHRLNLIHIPRSTLLEYSGTTLLIQERVEHEAGDEKQKELYQTHADALKEAELQLVDLIGRLKLSRVRPHHVPVIEHDPKQEGPRHIALLNSEATGNSTEGIFGYRNRPLTGLIGCVAKEHADLIRTKAQSVGSVESSLDSKPLPQSAAPAPLSSSAPGTV